VGHGASSEVFAGVSRNEQDKRTLIALICEFLLGQFFPDHPCMQFFLTVLRSNHSESPQLLTNKQTRNNATHSRLQLKHCEYALSVTIVAKYQAKIRREFVKG